MRKTFLVSLLASAAISSAAMAAADDPQSGQHRWQHSSQSSSSDDSPRAARGGGDHSRNGASEQPSAQQPRARPDRTWAGGNNGGGWGGRTGGSVATQGQVRTETATPSGRGFDPRLQAYRQSHQRNGGTVGSAGNRWTGRDTTSGATQTVRDNHYTGGTRYTGGNRTNWSSTSWRRDNRYDWNRYRDSHRSTFRLGMYYDPYGYNYRRFDIGFSLSPNYYQSNYWIEDPWMYRLPPVYGPYRWVRYWDDALLVDIYSGQVVDVIHDFFW